MKTEKEIYIKPENRMGEKEIAMAGFGNSKNTAPPVVEMQEDKVMPVYIFGGPLIFKSTLGDSRMDLMITVSHHIKEKKLELRGRMRYADTGRKTVFSYPQMFDVKDYDNAKQEARNIYLALIKTTPMKPSETAWELEFPIGETTNNIIQVMEDSNHFNIGISPKK